MTRLPKKCALMEALGTLAEGATPCQLQCRDWASATFVGQWHQILLQFEGFGAARKAEASAQKLARTLAVHEFALPGRLVADIAVCDIIHDGESSSIVVEALLLNETA
jgi:hypothetical protein